MLEREGVSRALDDGVLDVWQLRREQVRVFGGDQVIRVSGDDMHRDLDAVEL